MKQLCECPGQPHGHKCEHGDRGCELEATEHDHAGWGWLCRVCMPSLFSNRDSYVDRRLEGIDDAVAHGAMDNEHPILRNDMEWLIAELKGTRNENKTLHHNWDNLANELVKRDKVVESLVGACQLIMGKLGGEEGYIPSIGGPATDTIRAALRNAGVEPAYYRMEI